MHIGENIRTYRAALKISQSALEEKTGIRREYLSKIESGFMNNPTIKTVKKLADGLGVSIVALIQGPNFTPTQNAAEIKKKVIVIDLEIKAEQKKCNDLCEKIELLNNQKKALFSGLVS